MSWFCMFTGLAMAIFAGYLLHHIENNEEGRLNLKIWVISLLIVMISISSIAIISAETKGFMDARAIYKQELK